MAADDHRSDEELARLHDGVGHPARVAILRALREASPRPVADLVHEVSRRYKPVDTRTVQHHLYKMQTAGIVAVATHGGRGQVSLVRDVVLVVRMVPPEGPQLTSQQGTGSPGGRGRGS